MANNNQRGTSERIREKMLKMSEIARATIDNRAILPHAKETSQETSQANERALQERVDAAMREERLRFQEIERRSQNFI